MKIKRVLNVVKNMKNKETGTAGLEIVGSGFMVFDGIDKMKNGKKKSEAVKVVVISKEEEAEREKTAAAAIVEIMENNFEEALEEKDKLIKSQDEKFEEVLQKLAEVEKMMLSKVTPEVVEVIEIVEVEEVEPEKVSTAAKAKTKATKEEAKG